MIGLRSTMSGMAAPSHIAARAASRGALRRAADARWASAMGSRLPPPPVQRVGPHRPAPRISPPRFTGRAHPSRAPEPPRRHHTLFGVLDVLHMLATIYKERGVYVRSLGDRLHCQIPGWGSS